MDRHQRSNEAGQACIAVQLIYHGRIAPVKKLTVFLEAVERLRGYCARAGQVVAAEILGGEIPPGPHEAMLARRAEERGLDTVVRFAGPFVTSNLRALYARFPPRKTIFLFTGENESFGLSPLEAMRMGVPVVAPRSGGVVEVVSDDALGLCGGILVDVWGKTHEKKVEAYCSAVLELTRNEERLQWCGQVARGLSMRFTGDCMVTRYHDLFQSLGGVAQGGPLKVHYVSAGQFPYRVGGVSEWFRSLLQGWQRLAKRGLIYSLQLRVSSLVRGDGAIPTQYGTVVPQLLSFIPIQRTAPAAKSAKATTAPLGKLLQRLTTFPAEGTYTARFRGRPTSVRDVAILRELISACGATGCLGLMQRVGRELCNQLIPNWRREVGRRQWRSFLEYVSAARFFEFAELPSGDGEIILMDSPHPFGVGGVVSKYFDGVRLRRTPCPLVFVQHSTAAEGLFGQFLSAPDLVPTARRLLMQMFIFFKRLYYDHADCVVSVSRSVERDLRGTYGIPPNRIRVIPNGTDVGL